MKLLTAVSIAGNFYGQNMSSGKFAGSLGIHFCKLVLGGDCQLGRIPCATVLCFVQLGSR